MKIGSAICAFFLVGSAQAQEPEATGTAGSRGPTTTGARRLAVIVLGSSGFPAEKADELTEVLIAAVVSREDPSGRRVEVVGKEEFQARLGTDERESQECLSSESCLGRIGVELGVDEVIAGTVGTRPDGGYSLSLTRTDIASADTRGRVFRRVEGDERALVEEVQAATEELFAESGEAPAAEPALPTANESAHRHERLFLRAGVGGGGFTDSFEDGGGDFSGSAKGGSVAVEVLAGASIASSLVVGGGIFLDGAQSPKVNVSVGDPDDLEVGLLAAVAAFIDWFPIGGLWVQGGIGGARLTIRDAGVEVGDHNPAGAVLLLGLGYEWWIADEWSLGAGGRALAGTLTDDGIEHKVSAVSILFETTWD